LRMVRPARRDRLPPDCFDTNTASELPDDEIAMPDSKTPEPISEDKAGWRGLLRPHVVPLMLLLLAQAIQTIASLLLPNLSANVINDVSSRTIEARCCALAR
jgi:hypothetical protein